jgi:hypothetical protein
VQVTCMADVVSCDMAEWYTWLDLGGWKVTRVLTWQMTWSSSTFRFFGGGSDFSAAGTVVRRQLRRGAWRRMVAPFATKISSRRFLDLSDAMEVLVLRKNGRKIEFRGWKLSCTKNTPRKLKLSVDFLTQTHRTWNLALMPKWLIIQKRESTLNLSKEKHNCLITNLNALCYIENSYL